MALILLLIIPALIVGLVFVAMAVYNKYRNSRLESYDVMDDIGIGGAWKSHEAELPIINVFIQEVDKEFQRVYLAALAKFPKDFEDWRGDKVIHPRNVVSAWNEAVEFIEGYLRDKRVVHPTGMQNVDFLATHQRQEYVEPVQSPKPKGRVIDEFMEKNGFTEQSLVNIVMEKMRQDTQSKYKPDAISLLDTVNAQRIREDERKRMTEKFLKDLKDVQGKFVVEQEFLKSEVEERDARLMALVEERDRLKKKVEQLSVPVVIEPTIVIDGERVHPPLEILEGSRNSVSMSGGSVTLTPGGGGGIVVKAKRRVATKRKTPSRKATSKAKRKN